MHMKRREGTESRAMRNERTEKQRKYENIRARGNKAEKIEQRDESRQNKADQRKREIEWRE